MKKKRTPVLIDPGFRGIRFYFHNFLAIVVFENTP